MVATIFIDQQYPVRKVLKYVGLSPSSYYWQSDVANGNKRGLPASEFTKNQHGENVSNAIVVKQIKSLLSTEFVDYGYLKVTHYLRDTFHYIINHKKVYRLMSVNNLLYQPTRIKVGNKQWVSKLVPEPLVAFTYWEFDIKFMYIHGTGKLIPLLTVIDVYSRWMLGYMFKSSIKKEDVKLFFEHITTVYYQPDKIYVRCDNGSQFESTLVRDYFKKLKIEQEFTKPATPEQNAHIESYHSIIDKVICRGYEFETSNDMVNVLKRWGLFYNYKRIHSGTNYKSPYVNLLQQGIDIHEIFNLRSSLPEYIFIPLNKTETSAAEEQLVRDSLVEGNSTMRAK